MPIDPNELANAGLETLKLEVGDKWRGILVDIDPVPHNDFETGAPLFDKYGKPKTKWVARLRPSNATSADNDVAWWTQNQVQFSLRAAISLHPNNYLGAEIGIERMPDGVPRAKGYKGAADYRIVIITPAPTGWVNPFKHDATLNAVDIESPF
jgi:hypothetical protein